MDRHDRTFREVQPLLSAWLRLREPTQGENERLATEATFALLAQFLRQQIPAIPAIVQHPHTREQAAPLLQSLAHDFLQLRHLERSKAPPAQLAALDERVWRTIRALRQLGEAPPRPERSRRVPSERRLVLSFLALLLTLLLAGEALGTDWGADTDWTAPGWADEWDAEE